MPGTLLSTITIALYCAVALLLAMRLTRPAMAEKLNRNMLLAGGFIAVALHALVLYQGVFTTAGIDVSFFSIMSLFGLLIALLLLVGALGEPIENLGIVVLPLVALTVLTRLLGGEPQFLPASTAMGLKLHILISILAYSVLSIAAAQAILLYIQDRHLHNRHPGGFIRALPPLQTMEAILFRLIGLGFVALSLSLLSGAFYIEDLLGQHLVHKTFLSVVAWLLFAVLLWGRLQFGWRGRIAIRWVMSGFVLLLLAYFGSKFVLELVLSR